MFTMFYVCFRLVVLSFCIYNRTNIYKHISNITRLGENIKQNINNRNTLFPSRNLRYIYSRSGPGLDILCLCFVRVFLEAFLLYLCLLCLCVCFRLVFLSFRIYNRTNIYKHINTNIKKLREKHNKHNTNNRNTLFPSGNLRNMNSRSSRGLDILYFCFLLIDLCFFST